MEAIEIDRNSSVGIQKQLYLAIKHLIEANIWQPGTKVPPSRVLSDNLKVARETVKQAYLQLCLEGYLVSRGRQGTFVKETLLETASSIITAPKSESLSQYADELTSTKLSLRQSTTKVQISLFSRCPNFDRPQFETVRSSLLKTMRKVASSSETSHPLGSWRLRTAIARFLAPEREINCNAEQVAILPGFVDAIDLITRLHIDRGDVMLIEEPCYPAIKENAIAYGAKWGAVPTDRDGLVVESLLPLESNPKIIFTTPGHHFPTGGVMPFSRRLRLLKWARETGALIIEDDYDCEFTNGGKPAPALKSLDRDEQVIYLSSFKKLVPPLFCMDFLILPERLLSVYSRAMLLSVSPPAAEAQATLASFIQSGSMAKHVNRLKIVYSRRRHLLIQKLKDCFGNRIEVTGANSGLHFLIRIHSSLNSSEIVRRAAERGLEISDTREFYAGTAPNNEFIIGFGAVEDQEIEDAVEILYLASSTETRSV